MNQLTGKPNEWHRLYRSGTTNSPSMRITEVFQRGEPLNPKYSITFRNWNGLYEYKVKVSSKSGTIWRSFEYIEDVDNFLSEISDKIFWQGKFFNNRAEAIAFKRFSNAPFGNKILSERFKKSVIKYIVNYNRSTYDGAKKFKKSSVTIYHILINGGCKFIKASGRGVMKGYWTKTQ